MPVYRFTGAYQTMYPQLVGLAGDGSLVADPGMEVDFPDGPVPADWVLVEKTPETPPAATPPETPEAGPEPAPEAPVADPGPEPAPVIPEPAPAPVAPAEPAPAEPVQAQPFMFPGLTSFYR